MDQAGAEDKYTLPPDRAVRLLRAKVGELETFAKRRLTDEDDDHHRQSTVQTEVGYLAADIALVAGILADFMERTEQRWMSENSG